MCMLEGGSGSVKWSEEAWGKLCSEAQLGLPLISNTPKSQLPQLLNGNHHTFCRVCPESGKHATKAMPIKSFIVTTICQCLEGPELDSKVIQLVRVKARP